MNTQTSNKPLKVYNVHDNKFTREDPKFWEKIKFYQGDIFDMDDDEDDIFEYLLQEGVMKIVKENEERAKAMREAGLILCQEAQ